MLRSSDNIRFIVGDVNVINNMPNIKVLPIFSDLIMDFFAQLSNKLLNDRRAKGFVDVVSYAFWIRKGHNELTKQKYEIGNRLGRGIALHIAPSNVPVNFAVSFTSALLAGNPCIVRVSNKDFEQVNIICDAINDILENSLPEMKKYLAILRYEHSEEITQKLSDICDIRIIWGGNRTINEIRKAVLPPRAIEMTFADRHSIAIINSDEYLKQDPLKVAKDFYTDTFYTDQNACSSPRLVIWMGNSIEKAKEVFWEKLSKQVYTDFELQDVKVVDKLDSFCRLAAKGERIKLTKHSNKIYRVEVEKLDKDLMDYKDNSGYFFEYSAKNLEEIIPVLTKSCQTISYLGIDAVEIKDIVYSNGPRGVDRIVPMGGTMELSFIWDGYNMIEAMSRVIYIK